MNWRDIGDTTFEAWTAIIRARAPQSPILKAGRKAYDAARPHSRLCLGQMWAEDQFQTDPSTKFPVANYNPMNMKTPTGSGWMQFGDYPAGIQGWNDRITSLTYKNGIYAATTTLPELIHVYAPSSDNNDEAAYVRTIELIVAELNEFERDTGEPTVPTTPTVPMPTKDLYILVDAGHRETGTGGADANPVERELTDDMAEAYVKALRDAGYKADWYQRDLDLDDLPRDTRGSLDTVSLGINAYLKKRTEKNLVFVSCHYDGAHQDYHVIYPDETGLSTAYKGGAPGYDTAANNPLDIKLAQAIAFAFDKIPNMTPLDWGSPYVGLMSEGKTGVADAFKARLAMFAATVPVRDICVRLIIEHGGTDDVAARRSTFTEECAVAFVAAIKATYKVTTDQPTSVPTTPPPPPVKTFPPKRVPGPEKIEHQGVKLKRLDKTRFLCKQGGMFKTFPDDDAPDATKTPYKAGQKYTFDYGTTDGTWLFAKSGSWAPAKNFEVQVK